MAEKSMVIALIISLIFTGLGIAYAGDTKKGVIIFAIAVILNILGMWVSTIFHSLYGFTVSMLLTKKYNLLMELNSTPLFYFLNL